MHGTTSILTCYTHTHTHKHTHTERGSDLDVLKDQYIFTSMASDYPLPRCITVISRRLYCNSVQGQTVPSVACLLDISWKPLMLAVLMDTDWWGVIKCSRVSAGCDRMWPQRGRTEDLMALDKMCFKYIFTYSCSREVIYIAGKHCGLVVCIVASQQEGPGFDTQVGFLHILPVSVWVPSRYSGVLTQSRDMQVRLIGDSM